jgi:hypothetical protein
MIRARTRRLRSRSAKCAALLLALVVCASSPARADAVPAAAPTPVSSEPPGYRELIDEAVQEFGAQHYEESRSLFRHAHGIFPNARTHRGLGLTEFELRNYGECIKQFEAALKSTVKPLSEDLRVQTERTLARAYNFVARVVVDAKPGASTILLDGSPLEVSPGQALLVEIGEHTLEVSARGFAPARRQLRIQGGENERLTIILTQSRPEPRSREQPKEGRSRWYKNPWLWVGVGVVVGGAAAGAAVALARDTKGPTPYGGDSNTVISGP